MFATLKRFLPRRTRYTMKLKERVVAVILVGLIALAYIVLVYQSSAGLGRVSGHLWTLKDPFLRLRGQKEYSGSDDYGTGLLGWAFGNLTFRNVYHRPGIYSGRTYSKFDALMKNISTIPEDGHAKLLLKTRKDIDSQESYTVFHHRITNTALYQRGDDNIDKMMNYMSTGTIHRVVNRKGGTQLKFIITFENGMRALFKPIRMQRDEEIRPNQFYFTDYERHNAEIATFHLDRILDFRRVPPTAGRMFNITTDLQDNVRDNDIKKTFFVSPDKNHCFHGRCDYFCKTEFAICGDPDLIEGSLAAYLPSSDIIKRQTIEHPYRRSYSKFRIAKWEKNPFYCDEIKAKKTFSDTMLLDIMDMAVLDFLIGNMDRHHFEVFQIFQNNTYPIHLDHGRSFGRHSKDELSILAPIVQCCRIRQRTFTQLKLLSTDEFRLSDVMRESLSSDPLTPLLLELHLQALDRRLKTILETLAVCVGERGSDVVVDVSTQRESHVRQLV